MTRAALLRAWFALLALALATTLLTVPELRGSWTAAVGTGVLILAWLKARIILARYLRLAAAPAWQRGFEISLGLFCLFLFGLYLAPLSL